MGNEQEVKIGNDMIVLTIIFASAVLLFGLFAQTLENYRLIIVALVVFSLMTAFIGKQRKIGFISAFFLSFLLSPIVGLIVTLVSPKISDEEYKAKILQLTVTKPSIDSVTDQLFRLNELRKDGVLTEEEFAEQKQKILNA